MGAGALPLCRQRHNRRTGGFTVRFADGGRGIALTAIYADTGWIGQHLAALGMKVAYTPLGIVVALTFIGLPFVVRTVQPVLADLDREVEEAAASLGATRWQTITRVIFPTVMPALLTGFALAFARAVGEYGSVIFIYAEATAIAAVMLAASFVLLLAINMLQWWSRRRLS